MQNMGKIIKSYATTHQSISPGKGRDTLQQKAQIFWLKYGMAQPYTVVSSFLLIYNLQAKIFQIYVCLLAKFPVNYANFAQFAPKSRE